MTVPWLVGILGWGFTLVLPLLIWRALKPTIFHLVDKSWTWFKNEVFYRTPYGQQWSIRNKLEKAKNTDHWEILAGRKDFRRKYPIMVAYVEKRIAERNAK